MLSTVARRTAFQAASRRFASSAAHPPSSVHTRITAGIQSKTKGSSPNLGFYTARLGRTLTLVLPGVAFLSWPFVTRAIGYSTSR
ncbi:hypothetical protein ABW19_dt0207814 [Dactylella cylindrospora]|nr:hypothetical protein ABW19_dt0207814 [Dactylella cylindrospora]